MIRPHLRMMETLTRLGAETGSEPVSEQGDFGTEPEPVPEFGQVGVEPPSIFEENVDVSFDKVADFERDEEVDTPVMIVQPKTISLPPT